MHVHGEPIKGVAKDIPTVRYKVERWHWYHGFAFYLIVQGLSIGLAGLVNVAYSHRTKKPHHSFIGDVSYFKSLKQAKATPPSWMFGPVWTLNNISVIYGNVRALNMSENTPGRNTYLTLQAVSWLHYVLFSAAYFSLRSPINAVVVTLSMFGLTIASLLVSLFKMKDTPVACSLATLCLWLALASTGATAQALWNHDELYNVGPFAQPHPALVKAKVS